jgi:hypothetical protein
LDGGPTPPVLDEGGPLSRTQQPQQPVRAVGPTKPRASELLPSPPVQTLIPCRSEYTSVRPDCGDRSNDALLPVQGHLVHRAPTEIPVCWLKRSPSEGRSSGGVESGERELSPPLPHLHPPHRCLLRIQARREFSPPTPLPPPGQHSKAASSASVPTAFSYRHGWPPALPHP